AAPGGAREPGVDQLVEAPRELPGQEDRAPPAAAAQLRQPIDERLERLVPGDLPEPALAVARERTADAIRVVEALERRLGEGAARTPADRVGRVPLHLDDPPLADRRQKAAPGGALA